MKQEQILKKAIEKAVKNGFKMPVDGKFNGIVEDHLTGAYYAVIQCTKSIAVTMSAVLFIFSHDFAKAFWGEESHEYGEELRSDVWEGGMGGHYGAYFCGIEWQYHLQMMVLEKDPIKYLSKYV